MFESNHLSKIFAAHKSSHEIPEFKFRNMGKEDIKKREQRALGHSMSSLWPLQEPHSTDGLKHSGISTLNSGHSEGYPTVSGLSASASSSLAGTGFRPLMGSSHAGASDFGLLTNASSGSTTGTVGQQWLQSVGVASLSEQSPVHQLEHLQVHSLPLPI